ncbi:hypothetical protein KEM52_004036, partial [Ascosphaera acerosa]
VFRLVSSGTIEEIVYARQIYKQQQANIAYCASEERRYFQGVQERKDRKGEIFGLANLFQYQDKNVVLRDIVNRTNVAESRAGVSIADLQVDDDVVSAGAVGGDGDAAGMRDRAMSLIADSLVRGEDPLDSSTSAVVRASARASADPVQAILSEAGVEYTHKNSEVLGTSLVEQQLSRRARLAESSCTAGSSRIFDGHSDVALDGPAVAVAGALEPGYSFHPPQDVRRRQFCSMARHFGYGAATDFALAVEGMTPAERRGVLDRWYAARRGAMQHCRRRPRTASTSGGPDEPIEIS